MDKGEKRWRMIRIRRYCCFLLLLLWLLLGTAGVAKANPDPKLVLVVLTRVDFTDLGRGDYPYFQRLLAQGQVGLVSIRVPGRLTPEKVYQAISATPSGLTGSQGSHQETGLLGSALRRAGKGTVFLGNADLPWKPKRGAKTMISDDYGAVGREVSDQSILRVDPEFPFGYATDYQKIGALVLDALPASDLILVETGDLERLEGYRGIMTEERWRFWRSEILTRIDHMLGQLRAAVPPETGIVVFVATPSSADAGNVPPFLPLLIDQQQEEPGLLTSSATREQGLITSVDLGALLMDLVVGKQEGMEQIRTTPGTWQDLQHKSTYWWINLQQRTVILRIYIYLLLCLLLITLFLPFTSWRRLTALTREVLPTLAFLPLTLLLLAPFKVTSWPALTGLIILGVGGQWALARWLFPTRLLAYRGLLCSTALIILGDLLLGSKLMLASLFGPSRVLGLRFYGLGNEYLGVLLGTLLLGTADVLIQSPGRKWTGMLLGVVVLLIFSPSGGANFGGGVALAYGTWLICRRIKPRKVAKVNCLLFSLCLLAGLGFQLLKSGQGGRSHLDQALDLLRLGAWDLVLAIAVRKVQMNLGLIKYSPLGYLLLVGFILFIIGLNRVERVAGCDQHKAGWYWTGMMITVNTGLLALLVNDSGIVVLAPMVIYPLILLAELWMAQERKGLYARLAQAGRRCMANAKN